MSTYKALRKNPSAAPADPAILAALRDIPVAALSDNMHRNIGTVGLSPYHRSGPQTMAGTAVTARSRGGDNLTYLRALEFCRPGDVLVIDCGGDLDNAVVGGILSFYAAHIGVVGVVVDGAIRDVAEIRERGITVLLVEQRAQRTVAFADRTYLMANGEIRLTLTPADADDTSKMVAAYLS